MNDLARAQQYARALDGAMDGADEIGRVADELTAVAEAIRSDREIEVAMTSPALGLAQKHEILAAVARAAGLSEKTARLLRILAEQGHLGLLAPIAEAFARIRDRRLGILEAELTTATPIGSELAQRAQQALERTSGRKLRLSLKTDSALIGGMVARVGSTVYDGSVRSRLEALRSHLKRI